MSLRTDLSYVRLMATLRGGEAADLLRRDGAWPPVPPAGLARFVGGGDFLTVGRELVELFREHGGLRRDDRVVDIGCGVGRMAVPLVAELDAPAGSYDGFDISAPLIRWCRRHISSRAQHFRFVHADVRNLMYNRRGRWSGADYRWPYPDGAFTFAIATSLFTHLRAEETERYLAELGRTLAPGGRGVLTFFVLDSLAQSTSAPQIDFAHDLGPTKVRDVEVPEEAVGYTEAWLRETLGRHGLELAGPVVRGEWSGAPTTTRSFQDLVLVRRP